MTPAVKMAREALTPFTHPDLLKVLAHNVQGLESPIYGRDKAVLTLSHFHAAVAALRALEAEDEASDEGASQ